MDVSLYNGADQLFQGEIEIEQFAEAAAVVESVRQLPARFGDFSDELHWRNIWVIPLFPDVAQQVLKAAIELPPGAVDGSFKIGAGMAGFENLEEIPKIVQQSIFQMREELRVAADRSLEAFEALASHAIVAKDLIEPILIAVRVQKFDIGLTNHDVVRGRIVVQLLVPFLKEM